MRKMMTLAALLASFSLFTSVASADPKKQKAEDYGYTFGDDALLGNDLGNQFGLIKVRQGSVRDRLIRPRTQFIAEMLKSIENI